MSDFKHGLFNCGDCNTCLAAFCCTPCLHGRTASRIENYPAAPTSSTDYLNVSCLLSCLAFDLGLGCIPTWIQRAQMRERFGIKGNACGDFMATCCCTPCAQAQLEVEIRERGEEERLLGQQGYKSHGGMVYAQQQLQPSPSPQLPQYQQQPYSPPSQSPQPQQYQAYQPQEHQQNGVMYGQQAATK